MSNPQPILRRNIYSLTPHEIQKFIDGVKALKTPSPGVKNNPYDIYVNTHSDPGVVSKIHNEPLFLPWHRAFLLNFERHLQKAIGDTSFGLPYWDWTDDLDQTNHQGPLWRADSMGGAGHPVMDGPFSYDQGWETVPFNAFDVSFTEKLERNLALSPASDYPTRADIRALFTPTNSPRYDPSDYDAFRKKIEEYPHGYMHVWVGGQMGEVYTSVNDPVFWLHHANIDRLWAQWQLLFPTSPVVGTFTDGTVMNKDTKMPAVFGKEDVRLVKDVLQLKDGDTDYTYEYEAPLQLSAMFRSYKTEHTIDDDEILQTLSTSLKLQDENLRWPSKAARTHLRSALGPALTYIHANREIVSVFRTPFGTEDLKISTRHSDGIWTPEEYLISKGGVGIYKSADEPALAWFKDKLYCVYRGESHNEQLYMTTRGSDGRWSKETTLLPRDQGLFYSKAGPALAVFNDTLYCVHPGASDHDDFLWWTSTTDGSTWQRDQQFPKSHSIAKPALAVLNGTLYCVHRGGTGWDGNRLHWTRIIVTSWGLSWQESTILPNHFIDHGPGLAVWEQEAHNTPLLVCLYRTDKQSQTLLYATASIINNGNALLWTDGKPLPSVSYASPALITCPLPINTEAI